VTNATWCILRTAAPRTVSLAATLNKRGYVAWTPTLQRERKHVHRDAEMITMPMTPTFVFVDGRAARDMLAMAMRTEVGMPQFSVMRWCGRVPLIDDRELDALRSQERRARDAEGKRGRTRFEVGARVHVIEGPATGLSGRIVESKGTHALVAFGGGFQMRVASWLLLETNVSGETQPEHSGVAA